MMKMNKEDSLRGKIILSFHNGLMEEAAKEVRFSDSSTIALQPLQVASFGCSAGRIQVALTNRL